MPNLSDQRCLNHSLREAVARCPECGQFYCRECITEHEERVICAACLKKLVATRPAERRNFATLLRVLQASLGLFIVWLFFFLLGQALLAVPTAFHDGGFWNRGEW